jgi:transcriptional regulator of arginine metabolism
MSDDHQLTDAILAFLAKSSASDQRSLLAHLMQKGFALTQSTLSRRLKLLGIEKRNGVYVRAQANAMRVLQVLPVAPNLLVLKTEPGFAQALAARLDREALPGQAGTVAGDDTVFVAVQAAQLSSAVLKARLL